jgi:hypothetical protein
MCWRLSGWRPWGKARLFFSEEKNQKTFASGAHGSIQAMAGEVGEADT